MSLKPYTGAWCNSNHPFDASGANQQWLEKVVQHPAGLETSITIAIYASPQLVYHNRFLEDNIVLEPLGFSFFEDISFND